MPATGVDPHVTRPTTPPVVGAGVGAAPLVAVTAGAVVVRLAAGVAEGVVRAAADAVAICVVGDGGALPVGPGVTVNVLLGAAVARSSGIGDEALPPDAGSGAAHAASTTAATPSAGRHNMPER